MSLSHFRIEPLKSHELATKIASSKKPVSQNTLIEFSDTLINDANHRVDEALKEIQKNVASS